jgi:hypothetical protein
MGRTNIKAAHGINSATIHHGTFTVLVVTTSFMLVASMSCDLSSLTCASVRLVTLVFSLPTCAVISGNGLVLPDKALIAVRLVQLFISRLSTSMLNFKYSDTCFM